MSCRWLHGGALSVRTPQTGSSGTIDSRPLGSMRGDVANGRGAIHTYAHSARRATLRHATSAAARISPLTVPRSHQQNFISGGRRLRAAGDEAGPGRRSSRIQGSGSRAEMAASSSRHRDDTTQRHRGEPPATAPSPYRHYKGCYGVDLGADREGGMMKAASHVASGGCCPARLLPSLQRGSPSRSFITTGWPCGKPPAGAHPHPPKTPQGKGGRKAGFGVLGTLCLWRQ